MLRARGVNVNKIKYRKLSVTARSRVITFLRKLINDAVGNSRGTRGVFEHSDAIYVVQRCRMIQNRYKSKHPEIQTFPISLVPVPKGHVHSHATDDALNQALRSMCGSHEPLQHATQILKDHVRRRLLATKVDGDTDSTTTRTFGNEISFNGSRVSVRDSSTLCFPLLNHASTQYIPSADYKSNVTACTVALLGCTFMSERGCFS